MRFEDLIIRVIVAVCCWLIPVTAVWSSEGMAVDGLLDRAEILIGMSIVDKGADRSLEKAHVLVEAAAERLAELDVSKEETKALSLELEVVEEKLKIYSELYEERFYGIFPVARLIAQNAVKDEGFVFTEQLFHPPDVAAVNFAMKGLLRKIDRYKHPKVVITSHPGDRELETFVSEVLLREGSAIPVGRRALVRAFDRTDLEAFDRGDIDAELMDRLMTALDLVDLVLITVTQPIAPDNITVRRVRGDYYIRGEVVQGSPMEATPALWSESYEFYGFARDRRDQYWPIVVSKLLLLIIALAWAAMTPWGLTKPLKRFYRLSIGLMLFFFGFFFIVVLVTALRRIIPDSAAMAMSALWWPGVLGLFSILGGGLLAWIGQARITNIVPGARGGRAVGAIFGLVALGACVYFVGPLMLLDGILGVVNIVPLVLVSVSLATLFGLAARTGPPVPHYFMIGPLLLAPITGVCLLTAQPGNIWAMVGLAGTLCLVAWVRHRVKLSNGTEELDPSPEDAAKADQETLLKLHNKIIKRH